MEITRNQALGRGRRWFFRIWIGLTILIAVLVAVWAPFAEDVHGGMRPLATLIFIVMIMLLSGGLGWLVWLVLARRGGSAAPPGR